MTSELTRIQERINFGEEYELDPISYELRRSGRVLKLERIPTEVLLFLLQHRGNLVTREQIVERVWGKDTYLDTDNSINGAIRKIRQALKDDPERPRFIQTITGRGYRFIGPVVESISAPAPAGGVTPESVKLAPVSKLAYRRWLFFLGIICFTIVIAGAFWVRARTIRSHSASGRLMLAVLPFENLTGDPNQEYFSDGLTEEMLTRLGSLNPESLGVIARTSVMHYKGSQVPLTNIGRELGVQYVMEGSVRRDAGRVRISAQLIQVKDQSHLWAREYDREPKDLLTIQAEIAQEIAGEIQTTLGNRPAPSAGHQTVEPPSTSYEAYDLYLKGLYFWNKRTEGGFQTAAEYFRQASAKDPGFARAYAGLANTYGLISTWSFGPQSEFMPKARAAALKSLELDDRLAEGHTALALIAESYDYDWRTAEKEFRRAIELDPNYATAHEWYGEYLSWMGRFDEALAESERARQLDPLSPIIARDHAAILLRAGRYDAALAQCLAVLDLDPGFTQCSGLVVFIYTLQGRFQEALNHVTQQLRPHAPVWGQLAEATTYAAWGRSADAERALLKFQDAVRDRPRERDLPLNWVAIDIAFGRKDHAIATLQRAFSEHSNLITGIKVEHLYDPLRRDPRFQELLREAGFSAK